VNGLTNINYVFASDHNLQSINGMELRLLT